MQAAVDEAEEPRHREIFEEQLNNEQYRMEAVLDVFAEHLWATGVVPDCDTAEEVAEQLSQQFLAAWKTDHPGDASGSKDA